jgi:hypothetical protein
MWQLQEILSYVRQINVYKICTSGRTASRKLWIIPVTKIMAIIRNIRIVTYPGFAWPIRRFLDLMMEFIGALCNGLQQFTNHYLTHCHLHPTGNSSGTALSSKWTVLYSVVLFQFWSDLRLTVPSYSSSTRVPKKTPFSVVKYACLLLRYLAMDVLVLKAYSLGMCLPSRYLAMGICVTTFIIETHKYPKISIIWYSAHEFYDNPRVIPHRVFGWGTR